MGGLNHQEVRLFLGHQHQDLFGTHVQVHQFGVLERQVPEQGVQQFRACFEGLWGIDEDAGEVGVHALGLVLT